MFNLQITAGVKASVENPNFRCLVDADSDGPIKLTISDNIGFGFEDGVTADSVRSMLATNRDRDIELRVSSNGGYVFEAVSIANQLREHRGKVSAVVESLAFSAATIVLLGADETSIYDNATYGIHRSAGVAVGNAKTMRAVAEWLDLIDSQLADGYAKKTGTDIDQVNSWMDGTDDGTVWSGADAVNLGFIDNLISTSSDTTNKASNSLAMMHNRIKMAKLKTLNS